MILQLDSAILERTKESERLNMSLHRVITKVLSDKLYDKQSVTDTIKRITSQESPYIAYRAFQRFEEIAAYSNDSVEPQENLVFIHRLAQYGKPIASAELQKGVQEAIEEIDVFAEDSLLYGYRLNLLNIANGVTKDNMPYGVQMLNYYRNHHDDMAAVRAMPGFVSYNMGMAHAVYDIIKVNFDTDNFTRMIAPLALVGQMAGEEGFVDQLMDRSIGLLQTDSDFNRYNILGHFQYMTERQPAIFTPERLDVLTGLAKDALQSAEERVDQDDAPAVLSGYIDLWTSLVRTHTSHYNTDEKLSSVEEFAWTAGETTRRYEHVNTDWEDCDAKVDKLFNAIRSVQRRNNAV